jgi:hypothetical protein
MTAHALCDWCVLSATGTAYIEPGSPWQNPFVESFHSRVRAELLNVEELSPFRHSLSGSAFTTTAADHPRHVRLIPALPSPASHPHPSHSWWTDDGVRSLRFDHFNTLGAAPFDGRDAAGSEPLPLS